MTNVFYKIDAVAHYNHKQVEHKPDPNRRPQVFKVQNRNETDIIQSPDRSKCIHGNKHKGYLINRSEIFSSEREVSGGFNLDKICKEQEDHKNGKIEPVDLFGTVPADYKKQPRENNQVRNQCDRTLNWVLLIQQHINDIQHQ